MPTLSEQRRHDMVANQLVARGIADARVLAAMESVPREAFVDAFQQQAAYDDRPLPIGYGQTISQPYIVAYMTEALRLTGPEKVLEVGAGCGYAAAVLAKVASRVFTIERIEALADGAARRLAELGYHNVQVKSGDGSLGWPEEAPFDGIVVTAAGPRVPKSLRDQLKVGGRLVMPVGATWRGQSLVRVTRTGEHDFDEEMLTFVAFVPLIGAEGWDDDEDATG